MASTEPRISNDQLSIILGAVQALPVVEPQGLTKAEAIENMRPALEDALKNRGYTHEQLADVLTRQGIKITGNTLREYLRKKPALTYQDVFGLAEKYQSFESPAPTLASIKRLFPRLAGLSSKQIAECLTKAGYEVTTANVSAVIRRKGA